MAAVLVGVAACSATSSGEGLRQGAAVPGTPVPDAIVFRDCTDQLLSLGAPVPKPLKGTARFGCAQFRVPLDYSHPDGAHITLGLIRIHTTENTTQPAQSLLVNPGGPGGGGLDFGLSMFGELPPSVTRKYDIIAFDPRGVGQSSPVRCLTDIQKDAFAAASPDLTTLAGVRQAREMDLRFSQACAASIGAGLPFYNTVATARDMDQIRQGVGDDVMNYLGFSYGTELGWTYAHLFPNQVHTFVLDGAVDPKRRFASTSLVQLQGFEQAFGQFAAWCVTSPACRVLGDSTRAVERLFAATRHTPLRTNSARVLTESYASTGVIEALYSKREWPRLASALLAAGRGDGSALLSLADQYNQRRADGSYSNLVDAGSVIGCNDTPVRKSPSDAAVVATARAWAQRFPVFGADAAGTLLGCIGWQPHRTPIPPPSAATPTTVLVVGNLHDPATPWIGARDLAAGMGHARLLTWNGEGHTSYLSGSTCVDSYVSAYLVRGALPPAHTICPAVR